jgi:hypothetical protein
MTQINSLLSVRANEVFQRIINTVFNFRKAGCDDRPITFLRIGSVGLGSSVHEVYWNLKESDDGKIILQIFSYRQMTYQLSEGADKIWRGKCLRKNQMRVKLKPTGKLDIKSDRKTKSETIALAISTVSRPIPYIHELINSLRSDLPIRLIVGSPPTPYLEQYRDNHFVEIIRPTPLEWERFANCGVHHRASWNYWRTLTFGSSLPLCKGLIALEDDVVSARSWEDRLNAIIHHIEDAHEAPYALALYSTNNLPKSLEAPNHFVPYIIDRFYGLQAMYYPDSVRAGFADYLLKNGVESYSMPYDLLFREYLQKAGIPLFAAIPSLFQHIGQISTGLSERFHQARSFSNNL